MEASLFGNLKGRFQKLRAFVPYHTVVRRELVVLIKEVCDIEVTTKDITLINGTIAIRVSPVCKAEIMRNKETILYQLAERLGVQKTFSIV